MYRRIFVIFLGLILLAACSSPRSGSSSSDPPKTTPKIMGFLEVTVSEIENSTTPTAAAKWVSLPQEGLGAQAITLVNSLPTIGTRVVQVLDFNNSGNSVTSTRYVSSVLEITNTSSTTFNNLTFYALNNPATSIGGTALSSLIAGNGSAITDETLARSFVPGHGIYNSGWGPTVNASNAHLTYLTRDEVAVVKAQLGSVGISSTVEPLQYGFVARNARGGLTTAQKRIIGPAGCNPSGCNRGYMVISYAYPRSTLRSQSPDTYTLLFAVGYDSNNSWSQSLDEQANNTVAGLTISNSDLTSATEARTLSGTIYQGANQLLLCRIFTAGSLSNPLAWMGTLPSGQSSCPVPMPTKFSSNNLSSTAVTLSWVGPLNVMSFDLERGVGSTPTSWTPLTLTTPAATSFSDNGLNPQSTYTYHLRANTSEGTSNWINLSVSTPTAAPNTPQNFSYSNLSFSGITLSWNAATNADSYTVERGLGANPTAWVAVTSSPTASLSVQSPDLSPNTAYSFRLKANNAAGSSQWTTLTLTSSSVSNFPSCVITIPVSNESIGGYTQKISYNPGEEVQLKVNSPTGAFALAIYREGTAADLGDISQLKMYVPTIPGISQNLPTAVQPYQGVDWSTSFRFTIPLDWKGGLYNAKIIELQAPATRRNYCSQIAFVVKRNTVLQPTKAPVVVLAADYTWQAYNPWGGASFYACASLTCAGKTYSPIIGFQRPNPRNLNNNFVKEDTAFGTFSLLHWLEAQGYSYDVITDSDLDSDATALSGYKNLLLDRHGEYVSSSMYDRIQAHLNAGNNLINFGGDQMYWKVYRSGDLLEGRKDAPFVHTLTPTPEPGGLWRDIGRPESAILGVQYTWTDSQSYAPYVVRNASHWALAGTGLNNGDVFGATSPAGPGCSGWETDKVTSFTPPSFESIAKGTNPLNPGEAGDTGADMLYYKNAAGGNVFSAGSLIFVSCTKVDPIFTTIMRNVMNRFLAP